MFSGNLSFYKVKSSNIANENVGKVDYIPPRVDLSRRILFVAANCRIAQTTMYSGTRMAANMIPILRKVRRKEESNGLGTLGWTATQVQAKMVTIQLEIILHSDLPSESCTGDWKLSRRG
jgi:hypothetical protein